MNLRDNSKRAKQILNIFYVYGFLIFGLIAVEVISYNLFSQPELTSEELIRNGLIIGSIGFLYLLGAIFAAVYFIRWFRRSYYNLHLLGADLEFEESMASYAWMIPIVNFLRPYKIAKEIWYECQKHAKIEKIKSHGLVKLWWITWWVGTFIRYLESYMPTDTQEQLDASLGLVFIGGLIDFAALLLVIQFVKKVSTFEELLFRINNEIVIEDHLID